jgi:lysophospholipase L1-like esterase
MTCSTSLRKLSHYFIALTFLVVITVPVVSPAQVNFSRLVVVGDSLSAGFQNDSLLWSQQIHGYAKLVADQARVPLTLPLIAYPGIPNVLQLVSANPPVIQNAPGQSIGRLNPFMQPTDLAVPGATVSDALNTRPDYKFDNITDFVLGLPGLLFAKDMTQVEWAEALHPTVVILWIGNNDVLGSATQGTDQYLTSVADFRTSFDTVIQRLAATGAKLVVANLPDPTAAAYFVPAPIVCAEAQMSCSTSCNALLGLCPGDYVLLPAVEALLAGTQTLPLPPSDVLDAAEFANVHARGLAFNAIIANDAAQYHATLVDIYTLLNQVHASGYNVDGRTLTTFYLGGIFSLDGIHPTNTGYAILANQFISSINASRHTRIPLVDVEEVAEQDPLIIPSLGPDALYSTGPREMLKTLRH